MVDSLSHERADLHVRLLGPPIIAISDVPLNVRRRQARALLYYLAHDLQPAPRERLTLLFWPDVASSTARRNLTRLLSYLRQALPRDDVIETRGGTVALNTELVWSDCVAFEQMCAADRESAVALYRGPFLDGFTPDYGPEYDHWLMDAGRHYERLYLQTLSELINERREAGDTAAAIAYAQQYLATDELAEDVHRRLIELYADAGDQTAATRQFERCTLILERELGVAPLPETRAAYDAAREESQSPAGAISMPEPTWRTLPSLHLPLVGRQDAWQEVAAAYRRLGEGGVIFISGEPGVGKSRLMQEFAETQEALLLVGHSSSQPLPYGALVAALRFALAHPALGRGVRPIWLAETARVLPELHTRFPDLPPPVEVEPQQAQARLFEALTQMVLGLADEIPLLLCLDDVHQADEATLGWLHYVTGRLAGSGVCILATYRTHEADPLRLWQRELERAGVMADVPLGGLSPAAVTTVVRQVDEEVGDPAQLAGRIHAATGGNAFFVLEVVRELLESGRLVAADRDLPLPQTVQDTVLRRVSRLQPLSQQVLEMAAVLAPYVEVQTMVAAAGRREMDVVEGIETLVSGQLLSPDAEHFRFQHDLAREAVYQNIRPWRRRLLHRRAAEALAHHVVAEDSRLPAAIARHYAAADEAAQAIEYYHRAAVQAQEVFAHDEAIAYLRQALQLLPHTSDDEVAVTLLELLGISLQSRGQFDEAREAFMDALTRLSPTATVWGAGLLKRIAVSFMSQHRFDDAEAAVGEALARLGRVRDSQPETWQQMWLEVQLERMRLYYYQQRTPEERDALAELVRPVVDQIGTFEHHATYRAILVEYAYRHDRFRLSPELVDDAGDVLRMSLATEDTYRITEAYVRLSFCLMWSGQAAEAVDPLTTGLALAEEAGLIFNEVLLRTYLAFAYRLQGNLQQTHIHVRRSLQLARQSKMMPYVAAAESHLAWLAWQEDRPDKAAAKAETAVNLWSNFPYPFQWAAHWLLLAMALQQNQLPDAISSAQAMLDPGQQQLAEEIEAALATAVAAWGAGDKETTHAALARAVELAEQHGYL